MDKQTFDSAAYEKAEEVASVVISKQNDYGPKNILNAPGGPLMGLAVRLYDKIARLENLATNEGEPKNESLYDTATDIMGYGLVLAMYLDDKFTLPLETSVSHNLQVGNIHYEQYNGKK